MIWAARLSGKLRGLCGAYAYALSTFGSFFYGRHPKLRRLLTEVGEGVAQRVLRLHHVVEMIGQRSGQSQHTPVFALGVPQQLDLGLQLQVHGPRAAPKTLRDHLLGALQSQGRNQMKAI